MTRPSLTQLEVGAVLLATAAAAYLIWRASQAGGGILSGSNALTQNATNAAGQPVTAYQGAGVLGTLGAAANAASGGYLASLGEWLGGKVYDATHDTPTMAAQPVSPPAQRYQTGGQTYDPMPDDISGDMGYILSGMPSP